MSRGTWSQKRVRRVTQHWFTKQEGRAYLAEGGEACHGAFARKRGEQVRHDTHVRKKEGKQSMPHGTFKEDKPWLTRGVKHAVRHLLADRGREGEGNS